MAKDFSSMEDSNRSSNPSIHDVSLPSRRTVLRGGLGMTLTGLLAPLAADTARMLRAQLLRRLNR